GSSAELIKLNHSLLIGQPITKADVEVYGRFGTQLELVDDYVFTDLLIKELDSSGAANTLAFEFTKFTHAHAVVGETGKVVETVSAGWDRRKGDPASATLNENFSISDLAKQVGPDADLD